MEGLVFHWWYVPAALVVLAIIFGRRKGGVVKTRYSANFIIHDPRFAQSRPEGDYTIFKPGSPDKIDIDIENLPLAVGDVLELRVNGQHLSYIKVDRDKEAEFEHWSDEDVPFPQIKPNDEITVIYQNTVIISGHFQAKG